MLSVVLCFSRSCGTHCRSSYQTSILHQHQQDHLHAGKTLSKPGNYRKRSKRAKQGTSPLKPLQIFAGCPVNTFVLSSVQADKVLTVGERLREREASLLYNITLTLSLSVYGKQDQDGCYMVYKHYITAVLKKDDSDVSDLFACT